MPDHTLRDRRVLVVEDEYMLADDLTMELEDSGAVVIGPVGTVHDALAMIAGTSQIDAAILDVSLRGEMVFPAADLLVERNVPFLFTTGYDASVFPTRFAHVPRCEKPLSMARVTKAIGSLM